MRPVKQPLLPAEAKVVREAVAIRLAGELDDHSDRQVASLESAACKLGSVPRKDVWLAFSRKELDLLWHVIGNGAGDDVIDHLGLEAYEKRILGAAANRIADAGGCGGPRFNESGTL